MDFDFSEFFKTKLEANDFANRLATIAEKLYETNFNLEKTLLDQFGLNKKDRLMILLRNNNISVESNVALKQFFDLVQEKVAALPVLTMTLAFEPKQQTLEALSQWFMLNLNKQVLFEITVDPSLIAGATLTYKGKFLDYSIRSTFQQIFNDTLSAKAPQAQNQTKPTDSVPQHQDINTISLGR
jgi:F0F1-type ATP synthase delta subunit